MVCFDLGGVLVRICRTWTEAAVAAGVPHSLPEPSPVLSALAAFDLYQGGRLDLERYLHELSAFLGCSPEEALRAHKAIPLEPFPGTLELVRKLVARNVPIGCLSNTNSPHWKELTLSGRFPVMDLLTMRMASHEERLHKPDPAIFRRYEERFRLRPEEIVYFDDSPLNVSAALACGWRAFQVHPEAGDVAGQIEAVINAHLLRSSPQ